MKDQNYKANVEPSSEILEKYENSTPSIDIKLLKKSISFSYNKQESSKFTEYYFKSTLLKWYSMPYLDDLYQIFYEIRYSYIRHKSHLELYYKIKNNNQNKEIHSWRNKYYTENLIYRYYSLWEMIGRFFNCYFNGNFFSRSF